MDRFFVAVFLACRQRPRPIENLQPPDFRIPVASKRSEVRHEIRSVRFRAATVADLWRASPAWPPNTVQQVVADFLIRLSTDV